MSLPRSLAKQRAGQSDPAIFIAVFFTGDSDFLELVTYLKRHEKKVYIFSSKNNISQELKTGGDGYYDVPSIKADIWGKSLQYRK